MQHLISNHSVKCKPFHFFIRTLQLKNLQHPQKTAVLFTALKNKVLNFVIFQEFSGQQLISISHVHFNGSSYWMLRTLLCLMKVRQTLHYKYIHDHYILGGMKSIN